MQRKLEVKASHPTQNQTIYILSINDVIVGSSEDLTEINNLINNIEDKEQS